MRTIRTNSENSDFMDLVKKLDLYLAIVDGDDHDFYHQYNGIENLNHVVLIYENNIPLGCGAIKEYEHGSMEIKRMYTSPASRRKGVGTIILEELESWAAELNYAKCILETGKRQIEAIELYKKNGYKLIDNYGQYKGISNSLCFEKTL